MSEKKLSRFSRLGALALVAMLAASGAFAAPLTNVAGMTLVNGEAALETAGFTNRTVTSQGGSFSIPVGDISRTTPRANTEHDPANVVDVRTVATANAVFQWIGPDGGDLNTEANWFPQGAAPPTWPPVGTTSTDNGLRVNKGGSYTLASEMSVRNLAVQGGVTVTILNGGIIHTTGGGANGVWADTSVGPVGRIVIDEGGIFDGTRNMQIGGQSWAAVNYGGAAADGLINGELVINGTYVTSGHVNCSTNAARDVNSLIEIGGNGSATVGGKLRARANNTVIRFVGDADSFGVLALSNEFEVNGTLDIDTTAYTGGAGSWDIMTFVAAPNEGTNSTTLADWAATATLPAGWTVTPAADKVTLAFAGAGGDGDGDGDGGAGGAGTPEAGMPVTGAIGLGLLAAACALGGSMFLRKK